MVDINDLEARLKVLEEECARLKNIEAIKELKSHYWRCIDDKLWDELADCFSLNARVHYGFDVNLEGKKLIARFFKGLVSQQFSVSVHQGHNPEIQIINEFNAKGHWQLDQFGIENSTGQAIKIGASYDDEYFFEDGVWKISSSKINYIYRQVLELEEFTPRHSST
jgi:hypothetical protein